MAILKPSSLSPNNSSIDTTSQIVVSWKNNGDRQASYQLQIYNNSDNTIAYDTTKLASLNNFHIIPANTLVNGTQYKYQVTVWNSLNESAVSDWIVFKCSSTPIVSFTNLNDEGIILNNSYTFQASYSQSEGVSIKSWQLFLYDINNSLLLSSLETFNNLIEYEITSLQNERNYKVEVQVKSQDNLLASTGKVSFSVSYETPKSGVALEAINDKETGNIKLQWDVRQITGVGTNYTLADGEANVQDGEIHFDQGFDIEDNFSNEIILRGITDYTYIIHQNTKIIASATPPEDTSVLWLKDANRTTPKEMLIIRSSVPPSDTDSYLWINDPSIIVPVVLGVTQDIKAPTSTNVLWNKTLSASEDESEILVMKNSNENIISLRYYNGAFHLLENGVTMQSVPVTGTKFYIFIRQINGVLNLHAEAIS